MDSTQISSRKSFIIVGLIAVILLALLIPAKRASFAHLRSDEADDLATYDTIAEDTSYVEPSLPDSAIVGDQRPVNRAGFEDGYTSGSTDAAMRQGRGTYDEQNPYPSAERGTYVEGYREGYKQGQTFGNEHPSTTSDNDHRTIEDLVRESNDRLQQSP